MTHQGGYPGTLVGTLSDRGIPSIVAESGYLVDVQRAGDRGARERGAQRDAALRAARGQARAHPVATTR